MSVINNVAIVGGTHGNEYSGIYLLKKWQDNADLIKRDSFNISTLIANPRAYEENKRYLDCDLNRQFSHANLNDSSLGNYEQSRAKVINLLLGPKGNARTDFVIDLHNTTSNMGPSLILPQNGDVYNKLAAYVKLRMPESVIILEDDGNGDDAHYLCNVGTYGVMIEIGPQPQSVIRQDVLDWMETMTTHILDFIDLYNSQQLPELPNSTEVFFYTETIKLPTDEQGERIGMVHKDIQDNDFKALHPGDPIFTLFNGEVITYQGDEVVYPHFINEAAYYDNNLAMSFAIKTTIELD